MKAKTRAFIELHIAVLLFGFTAILGKLISLPALTLVWWRVFITTLSLIFLVKIFSLFRRLEKKYLFRFLGIGVLVGLHWITFYGSIKLSNASICLVCMATTSLFTSFLEPAILKQKINVVEILLGLLVIPGMIMIVNNIKVEMMMGIWAGLLSAFLASLFSILNKKYIDKADSLEITFLEIGSAWIFISLMIPFIPQHFTSEQFWPQDLDWVYLIVLALLCTTFAYYLALRTLNHLSAFAANLTVNLEPVYGILLAIVILNEDQELTPGFYIGVGIIILAVLSYPLLMKNRANQKS